MGTWWLGRLQTERDKARVLDGPQGAADAQGGGFNRKQMENMLPGLDSRVFLMNNVHDGSPSVFHVRWVMSYLRGPMTRRQIKTLMDPKCSQFKTSQKEVSAPGNPMAMSQAPKAPKGERPLVGQGVQEYFAPYAGEADDVTYKPALLCEATVHFSLSKCDLDSSRLVRFTNPMEEKGIDWENACGCTIPVKQLNSKPRKGTGFGELVGYAMNADNYKSVEKEFADWIYRNERVSLFHSPLYKEYSKLGESEGDLRARLSVKGREARDEAVEKMWDKYEKKFLTKNDQLERADLALDREQAEASSATWSAGASVLGGLFGGLFGGRKSRSSSVTSATRAFKQRRDVGIAEEKVENYERDIA